jgi:uncharacterized iron-regulated membrane protein
LVARASEAVPGARPVRYTEGTAARDPLVVVMTRNAPGDRINAAEVWVHYDKYDGRLLGVRPQAGTSAGDWLMAWLFPLHAGWFGGLGVQMLWAVLAMSLPVLSITGVVMWWNRVIAPRQVREKRRQPRGARSYAS